MKETDAHVFHPRVFIPFAVITLIWGSTWLVIKDQLGVVPAAWSVTYRFIFAALVMFAYAVATGANLRIGREGHLLALGFGIPQFVLNYNAVYAAERHVTSGLVAVMFALLLVPNALFGRLFLKHAITGRFLAGSAIAVAGVALLFLHELRASTASGADVAIGILFALFAVLTASIANVMQAGSRIRARPLAAMLAWGMAYGALADGLFARAVDGPPIVEARAGYWIGLLYLGVIASALAFFLYFKVIRVIGPARAAYSSLIIPVIAMALSTAFEGYRWTWLAAAGGALALAGLFIALKSREPA